MQTPENNRDQRPEDLEAPARLVSALGSLPKPSIFIPPTVDEAILRSAERHLAVRRQKGSNPVWMLCFRWAAAAATAVLLLTVIPQLLKNGDTGFAREDINQDGKLDIVDAFTLARQLRTGEAGSKLDFDGDGRVDDRDVSIVAAQAVSLEKRGRS